MQHTAVKPPAAAARVPVATVSLYSKPGSRRCTWMSMKPGHTTLPLASTAGMSGTAAEVRTDALHEAVADQHVLDGVDPVGGIDARARS